MSESSRENDNTPKLKLATININGFRGRFKYQQFFFKAYTAITNLIKNNYVVCVQEPKINRQVAYLLSIKMRAHVTLQGPGLVTLIPKGVQIINKQVMLGGRLHSTTLIIHNKKYSIVNIYAPTKANQHQKADFFKNVESSIEDIVETNVNSQIILCGDFNIDLDAVSLPSKALCKIINRFELKDAFRYRHPNSKGYTRIPSQHQWGKPKRMDAFLFHKK